MSGSETGILTSSEPYSVGLQSAPVLQNMRLFFSADGTAVYRPITPSSSSLYPSDAGVASEVSSDGGCLVSQGNMGSEPLKRKRGRPRKYGPDGTMAMGLSPPKESGGFSPSNSQAAVSGGPASPTSLKKARGRPPGSGNKKQQKEALGSAGVGFTPHIVTVKAGEDVSSKILSLSQSGSRAVCVLSANGAISSVTLQQPATSCGTVTYEGRYEILSLCGTFLVSENEGQRSRSGGLSVSLAGPDGRILGGGVAGLLMAASPVQVVVGSFIAGATPN